MNPKLQHELILLFICKVSMPLQRKKYTLEELLDGMTPEHFHPEIPTGSPVGNELFEPLVT
jgi:antitoxin component of MazEF toxin-antitoxin module